MKKYILPFFIPFQGCPFKCIYCEQHSITNETGFDIKKRIKDFFKYKQDEEFDLEVAFFGGTFTALSNKLQKSYLKKVTDSKYYKRISGIRISTRPDCIDKKNLKMLKKFDMKHIELGVQSFNNKYLKFLRRGYEQKDVLKSINLIKKHNIKLGLQIMMGFFNQTKKEFMADINKIIDLNPSDCRIYPLTVIKNTELADIYKNSDKEFMKMKKAVKWLSEAVEKIEDNNIEIRRLGLPHSKELGKKVIAGLYHPSLFDKVRYNIIKNKIKNLNKNIGQIKVNPKDFQYSKSIVKNSKLKIKVKKSRKVKRGKLL